MFGFTTLAIAAATAVGHRNSVHAWTSDEVADPPRAENEERLLQGGVLPGAGCYPTFSASMLYTKGSLVSAILTTRTPTTYESCTGYTDGCNGAYRKVGGEQVTAKYNWKCESAVRCTQAGFEPSSENGAWTRMEECDVSLSCIVRFLQPFFTYQVIHLDDYLSGVCTSTNPLGTIFVGTWRMSSHILKW